MKSSLPQKILSTIATVWFVGYAPVASGTFGTLAALVFFVALWPTDFTLLMITAAVIVVGTVAADVAEGYFNEKDSHRIVIDEVAGFFVSILYVPKGFIVLVLAFFLFRGFDIIKPPPVNYMERIKGGLGVMLDDVAAGIYVNIILQIATRMRFF
ncbi:phosphatidylglycerophosphatase A [Candidatus Magnetominusculus dajiuhuensis]|uniref:phosphatidylglycerophosphatase A family protein n=1 Tax=Candidatus Magnetominusculus dajiuhuensis TaxID=3137712 RepID=UPI003B42B9D5